MKNRYFTRRYIAFAIDVSIASLICDYIIKKMSLLNAILTRNEDTLTLNILENY